MKLVLRSNDQVEQWMSSTRRLVTGILAGASIYVVGLFVIPSWEPIEAIIDSTSISAANITQMVYLTISITLMLILSRGKLSTFGFRLVKLKPLALAVLISILFELVLLTIMMISIDLFTPQPMMPEQAGQLSMSFPRTIISIWLIASTCEELFFRGLIYGFLEPLKKSRFILLSKYISLPVAVAAIMFGLGHLCLLSFMPPLIVANIVLSTTTCGFVAGYFRETTGSLIPAIAAHMTFNVVGSGIPMLMGMSG